MGYKKHHSKFLFSVFARDGGTTNSLFAQMVPSAAGAAQPGMRGRSYIGGQSPVLSAGVEILSGQQQERICLFLLQSFLQKIMRTLESVLK